MNVELLADRLRARIDILADAAARDLGLPRRFVRAQLDFTANAVASIGTINSRRSDREVAFLFPGNTEGGMAIFLIAQARAMGWNVRAKVSSRAPGIQVALVQCFADVHGVQVEAVNGPEFLRSALRDDIVEYIQVFGDDAWIDGYRLEVVRAMKPLAFDGPGKDALLILEGADVSAAVDAAIDLGLFAGGAACMSAERFFVHESVADAFVQRLVAHLSEIQPVPPWEGDGVLGVASSRRAVDRMTLQIREAMSVGAKLVLGSPGVIEIKSPTGKDFFACVPTVLVDVPKQADILKSETFGPVFPVVKFKGGTAEGVKLVEDSQYGLTATVLGPADEANRAAHVLRTSHAIVYVNTTMMTDFRPEFWGSGGFKKSGWVWAINRRTNTFTVRHGFRTLVDELTTAGLAAKEEKTKCCLS